MYGIAFDLGTTTLVAYLCNLETGIIERTDSMFNPQIETGADILTRLTYSQKSPENKKHLENLLGDAIHELAKKILEETLKVSGAEDCQKAKAVPVAGNRPEAKAVHDVCECERILLVGNPIIMGSIKDYTLDDLAKEVIRLPGIGNFVGADALAASYLLSSQRASGNTMFIDIGTNTEIVLLSGKGKFATSAAAGPAMEGGTISCGMVACDGAISIVTTTNGKDSNSDLSFKVITDNNSDRFNRTEPKGICGSGLISLLNTLRCVGAMDETGYLLSRSEAIACNVPGRIAGRILEGSDNPDTPYSCRYIRITDRVFVSQEDIRNLQLAFSAIHSGIDVLLQHAQMNPEDFDNIYLAGAFGTTIRRTDWVNLNMLPDFYADRVTEAGNLAGLGAAHILMNAGCISEVTKLKEEIISLQLDRIPSFEQIFIDNMHF